MMTLSFGLYISPVSKGFIQEWIFLGLSKEFLYRRIQLFPKSTDASETRWVGVSLSFRPKSMDSVE